MLRILLILIFSTTTLFAEEEGFFGKDFDMNVFNTRNEEVSKEEAPKEPRNSQEESEKVKEPIVNNDRDLILGDKNNQQKNVLDVIWLGGIFNAHDQDHFFEEISSFLAFVIEHDFDLGPVYAVGKEERSQQMNLISTRINARGGQIIFGAEPPQQFAVNKSPAWIVATKEGQVVLEGLANFQTYFNSSGKLILK